MPRLRNRLVGAITTGGSGVPAEFLDENSEVWQSRAATLTFLEGFGLTASGPAMDYGPASRCRAAGLVWARYAGFVRPVSYGTGEDLDLARMRAAGVRAGWAGGSASRERREQLRP